MTTETEQTATLKLSLPRDASTVAHHPSEDLPMAHLNPLMGMMETAAVAGDLDMMRAIIEMRDGEDRRAAAREFNIAFAKAQAEFPIIPKRGRGHNNIQYARVEDILQAVQPILSKYGLSVRHASDTQGGVKVTATLSHVSGHAEHDEFVASPDTSGSKNAIQAIKSAITYARRSTLENLLGLASHGEDDDAFASGDTPIMAEWREKIGEAKSVDTLDTLRANLMASTEVTATERVTIGHVWTAKRKTFPASAA
jgi:hypothetical protein